MDCEGFTLFKLYNYVTPVAAIATASVGGMAYFDPAGTFVEDFDEAVVSHKLLPLYAQLGALLLAVILIVQQLVYAFQLWLLEDKEETQRSPLRNRIVTLAHAAVVTVLHFSHEKLDNDMFVYGVPEDSTSTKWWYFVLAWFLVGWDIVAAFWQSFKLTEATVSWAQSLLVALYTAFMLFITSLFLNTEPVMANNNATEVINASMAKLDVVLECNPLDNCRQVCADKLKDHQSMVLNRTDCAIYNNLVEGGLVHASIWPRFGLILIALALATLATAVKCCKKAGKFRRGAAVAEDLVTSLVLAICLYQSSAYLGQNLLELDFGLAAVPVILSLAATGLITFAAKDINYMELPGGSETTGTNVSKGMEWKHFAKAVGAIGILALGIIAEPKCKTSMVSEMLMPWALVGVAFIILLRKLTESIFRRVQELKEEDNKEFSKESKILMDRFGVAESLAIVVIVGYMFGLKCREDWWPWALATFAVIERLSRFGPGEENVQLDSSQFKGRSWLAFLFIAASIVFTFMAEFGENLKMTLAIFVVILKFVHAAIAAVYALPERWKEQPVIGPLMRFAKTSHELFVRWVRPLVATAVLLMNAWLLGIDALTEHGWEQFLALALYAAYEVFGDRFV